MRIESRELLAVGMFGGKSHLGDRIEKLLRRGRTFSPRMSATGVAVSAIGLCGLMVAGSLVPRWIAFAQPAPPSFEVASIKPSPPLSAKGVVFGMIDDPDRFNGSYVTLLDLMARAYGVEHSRISGGPSWLLSDRFDVIAKLPTGTPRGQIPLMLQTLLSERFRLIVRRESRMTRVYALVPAKGGAEAEAIRDGKQPGARRASHVVFGPSHDGLEWRTWNMLWQGKAQQGLDGTFRRAAVRGNRPARAG